MEAKIASAPRIFTKIMKPYKTVYYARSDWLKTIFHNSMEA